MPMRMPILVDLNMRLRPTMGRSPIWNWYRIHSGMDADPVSRTSRTGLGKTTQNGTRFAQTAGMLRSVHSRFKPIPDCVGMAFGQIFNSM
jgi:hypothetical protein